MDAVFVTHNSGADLRALTSSRETVASFRRIVVVDNASSDDTRALAEMAGFEVVGLPVNRGFAAAANFGACQVRGPFFALLNPDVSFSDPSDVQRLQDHFLDPDVGAVAPALVLPSGKIQDSVRRVPTPFELLLRRFSGRQPDAIRVDHPANVEWAVGACLILRRAAFDRIGGFDERYFLYFEDVDFGVRLNSAGYRLRYDPTVRAFHNHRAASRSAVTTAAARHHIRSAARFYAGQPMRMIPRKRRAS